MATQTGTLDEYLRANLASRMMNDPGGNDPLALGGAITNSPDLVAREMARTGQTREQLARAFGWLGPGEAQAPGNLKTSFDANGIVTSPITEDSGGGFGDIAKFLAPIMAGVAAGGMMGGFGGWPGLGGAEASWGVNAAGSGTAGEMAGLGGWEGMGAIAPGTAAAGIPPGLVQAVTSAAKSGMSAQSISQMLGISGSLLGNIASIAGPVVGALLQSNSAENAANQQQQGTDAAIAESRRQYDLSRGDLLSQNATNRADLEPWRTAGASAIGDLSGKMAPGGSLTKNFTLADFWADPVTQASYQSGLDLGEKGLRNMAAARGSLNSGAQLKALTRFGTDYTGQQAAGSQARFAGDQTNLYNRLAGIAGTGQNATNNMVSSGSNTASTIAGLGANNASTIGGLLSSQGNARGAATLAGGNAYGSAFNTIGNYYGQQQTLDKLLNGRNSGYGSGSYNSGGSYQPYYAMSSDNYG